jgi:CO dehydrogenase maturation factor
LTYSIAVAGKGGSGKTSITTLIIRYLLKNNLVPILAIDADANANLGESLGLKTKQTVGSIIAAFNNEKMGIPPGMTKEAYLEYRMNETIVESKGLDMITMGRGEGLGCYCYPNDVLREFTNSLMTNYKYVVMDNEAGMEHLSRRTTNNIDVLLLVSNHSVKGVRTLARIRDLVKELKLDIGRLLVVVNMVPGELDPLVQAELDRIGLQPTVIIPEDEILYQYDLELKSLIEMPDNSKAVQEIDKLMNNILQVRE